MSSRLGWAPIKPTKYDGLSTELKFAMRKKYNEPVNVELGRQDILYLEGLRDAGIKDAQKLITAIEKHDVIEVIEEY